MAESTSGKRKEEDGCYVIIIRKHCHKTIKGVSLAIIVVKGCSPGGGVNNRPTAGENAETVNVNQCFSLHICNIDLSCVTYPKGIFSQLKNLYVRSITVKSCLSFPGFCSSKAD